MFWKKKNNPPDDERIKKLEERVDLLEKSQITIDKFTRTLDTKLYLFEQEVKGKEKVNNNGKHK